MNLTNILLKFFGENEKQKILFFKFFNKLKKHIDFFEISKKNEIVFVKHTDTGQRLLAIDNIGNGFIGYIDKQDNTKHQRFCFEYETLEFMNLVKKFKQDQK